MPVGPGLVPGPRAGPGPDAGGGQRLQHRVQVVAPRLLEQGGAEPDHLRRRVLGVHVHVLVGQRGERGVDEPAQRVQRLAALRHRPLGAAEQVPVPVHQAGHDHPVRGVDQPPRRVPGQDVVPLADRHDRAAVDGQGTRPVDIPLRVQGEQPAARDHRVHRDRPGRGTRPSRGAHPAARLRAGARSCPRRHPWGSSVAAGAAHRIAREIQGDRSDLRSEARIQAPAPSIPST